MRFTVHANSFCKNNVSNLITRLFAKVHGMDTLVPVLTAQEEMSYYSFEQHPHLPVSVVQLRAADYQSPKSRGEESLAPLAV